MQYNVINLNEQKKTVKTNCKYSVTCTVQQHYNSHSDDAYKDLKVLCVNCTCWFWLTHILFIFFKVFLFFTTFCRRTPLKFSSQILFLLKEKEMKKYYQTRWMLSFTDTDLVQITIMHSFSLNVEYATLSNECRRQICICNH